MPINNSTSQKTRTAYHEQNSFTRSEWHEDATDIQIQGGLTREAMAESQVAREDELIWAWSRDPDTDLTQIEARDRAQSHGYASKTIAPDYGRYNISQSSLSRKLKKMDDTMLHGGVILLNGKEFYEEPAFVDYKLHDNPEFVDRQRELLARYLCDLHALSQFDNAAEQTPQWAQDRFPDMDPNLGRQAGRRRADRTGDSVEQLCGGLHEPHE